MASRSFTMADQHAFAALSQDRNPIHTDPLAARRSQHGLPLVHGMHLALWALEQALATRPGARFGGLVAKFEKPVLVGDTVTLTEAEAAGALTLTLGPPGLACMVLRLTGAAPRGVPGAPPAPPLAPTPPRPEPRVLDWDGLAGQAGALALPAAPLLAAFPTLAAALGPGVVVGLAAASAVVGMECPGLHSLFGSLSAALTGPQPAGPVQWAVARMDERFRRVELALHAPGMAATLAAFMRPPPVAQPDVAELVRPREFAGQRALVVGGSRGLGEATARLLAAGGAEVTLTYAAGAEDAARVAAAIGGAEVLRYDAREPAAPQLAALRLRPNALYYCATGPVFRRKAAFWEPALMAEHLAVYAEGFQDLALALHARSGALLAFMPSSAAVEQPVAGLAEYAAAKLAGEAVAAHLAAFHRGLHVLVKRLPRVQTDLTAGIAQAEAAEAVDVMLPILREMQAMLAATSAPAP